MMLSQTYYLIRSQADGSYLAAHPRSTDADTPSPAFLLVFRDYADALSYLNTHAAELTEQFAVETLAATQLKSTLDRWSFSGLGMVQDPLIPTVEFLHLA